MRSLLSQSKPDISVVMSVYNGEKYLTAAINSILKQTFDNFEFIIVDDGSTDCSLPILHSFANKDSRILVIARSNRGLAFSLNEAISIARGKFVARMDADDLSFPERLATQYAYLQSHPDVDLLACRAVVFSEKNSDFLMSLPYRKTHEEICSSMWRNIPLAHPTWMGRIEFFKSNHYLIPEVRRAEDQELLYRVSGHSKFVSLNKYLLAYRQDEVKLRQIFRGRFSLFVIQSTLFIKKRAWYFLILSFLNMLIKMNVDLVSVFPGMKSFFSLRFKKNVPRNVQIAFTRMMKEIG